MSKKLQNYLEVYEVTSNGFEKAICKKSNYEIVTKWWESIHMYEDGYYMVFDGKKYAICHLDNPDQPVTKWWDKILRKSYVPYYRVMHEISITKQEYAIFHLDNPEEPVTRWWNWIYKEGLIEGKSKYYIVNNGLKDAIFHLDDPDKPISKWWYDIIAYNLLCGRAEHYMTSSLQTFHISDPEHPLSSEELRRLMELEKKKYRELQNNSASYRQ